MDSQAKNGRRRALALALCIAAIAGCATDPAPVEDRSLGGREPVAAPAAVRVDESTYQVVRGDTLYAIAFKRGLDYRDVAAWNGIAPPYTILVGQQLHLTPPQAGSRTSAIAQVNSSHAEPTSMPTPAKSSPTSAAVTTAAAAPSKGGSMFEDVPSQFSPPPAPASAPAAEAATQQRASNVASESPDTSTDRTAQETKAAAAARVAAATPARAETPEVAIATKPAATPPPEPSPVPTKSVSESASANAGGVAWHWPSAGKLLGGFVVGDQTKQGIDIGGNEGDPVHAAADGEVVYSGNGLIGYGELIIVKHNASYLSAYGHNRKRLVQEGEKVHAGQQIAEMGSSASARDELHFEIRKNGKPVNPMDYLPAR